MPGPKAKVSGRKHCSRCGRWRSILDFRPRAWDRHGCIKYVASDCDPCHQKVTKGRYHKLPYSRKQELWKRSAESHARARQKGRVKAILDEALARPKQKIKVQKGIHWKREGIVPRDLVADSRGDYLWAVHHALKIVPHNPARIGHPMSAEFHAMSADLECKHGTCPGDAKPQPGCPGYSECTG